MRERKRSNLRNANALQVAPRSFEYSRDLSATTYKNRVKYARGRNSRKLLSQQNHPFGSPFAKKDENEKRKQFSKCKIESDKKWETIIGAKGGLDFRGRGDFLRR